MTAAWSQPSPTRSARLDCPEVIGYGEFGQNLRRRIGSDRVPLGGTIEVTWRCNQSCRHCYNNLPANDAAARRNELTRDEHCRLLDEIADAGCLWLLFTGGEVFTRGDFLDIYRHAKQKGFLITIFSNGTTITPRIADDLAEWRPFRIEITLYGRTQETHERFTGTPGSYDACLRGIRLLLERRLPLSLKTVATTINQHEVAAMKAFAEEELGVKFRFDAMLNARLDRSLAPIPFRLKPEEIVALDVRDPARHAEWQTFAASHVASVAPSAAAKGIYGCGAGARSFSVDPFGWLRLCAFSRSDGFDLREGSFREGWETVLARLRATPATRATKCTMCRLKALCGMCPAVGELELQDPEAPVDFYCEVGHLRAAVLGLPVAPHGECAFCTGPGRDAVAASVSRLNALHRSIGDRPGTPPYPTLAGAPNVEPILRKA